MISMAVQGSARLGTLGQGKARFGEELVVSSSRS